MTIKRGEMMAQAQSAMLFWMDLLTVRASIEAKSEKRDSQDREAWNPRRVSDAQAIDQAAAMVDRFSRIFVRTLRALRDLRRYASVVVVQNAGQVNVGDQQVNMASQAAP
jgi:hypothetical protein